MPEVFTKFSTQGKATMEFREHFLAPNFWLACSLLQLLLPVLLEFFPKLCSLSVDHGLEQNFQTSDVPCQHFYHSETVLLTPICPGSLSFSVLCHSANETAVPCWRCTSLYPAEKMSSGRKLDRHRAHFTCFLPLRITILYIF